MGLSARASPKGTKKKRERRCLEFEIILRIVCAISRSKNPLESLGSHAHVCEHGPSKQDRYLGVTLCTTITQQRREAVAPTTQA